MKAVSEVYRRLRFALVLIFAEPLKSIPCILQTRSTENSGALFIRLPPLIVCRTAQHLLTQHE